MMKYVYIGAIAQQTQLALVRGTLPYDKIDKALKAKEPLVVTARRVGSSGYAGAKPLEALGVPIKIVSGYRGSAEELTALERGEADLFIASLSTIQALRPE